MKCENCYGFGYVKILNNADEVIEMECPVCKGTGKVAHPTPERR